MTESLRIERLESVARVTMTRPASLNAMSPELIDALRDAAVASSGEGARCLLLTGEGRGFSSG